MRDVALFYVATYTHRVFLINLRYTGVLEMKTLSLEQVCHVAGGDYQLHLEAFVPTSAGPYVTNLFDMLINGQLPDTAAFIAAMQNDPNMIAAFNKVRVESVSFSEFN